MDRAADSLRDVANDPMILIFIAIVVVLVVLLRVLSASRRRGRPAARRTARTPLPARGQRGPHATVEVDARRLTGLRLAYSPSRDGTPDPGEIVWTWVPFQENDGRGKDRPVLVVAAEADGTVVAVQLTSKEHDIRSVDFIPLGAGPWDGQGRPSWANIGRVFRVHPDGMRREAAALDREGYRMVATALRRRYGWH
jgi:PemK-like protein.